MLSIEHGKSKLINQVFLIRSVRRIITLHRYVFRCSCKSASKLSVLSEPYDTDTILKRDTLERENGRSKNKGREREGNCVKKCSIYCICSDIVVSVCKSSCCNSVQHRARKLWKKEIVNEMERIIDLFLDTQFYFFATYIEMITNTTKKKEFIFRCMLVTTIEESMLRGLIFFIFSFSFNASKDSTRLRVELFIHPLMKKQKKEWKSNFYRSTDDGRRKHFNLLFKLHKPSLVVVHKLHFQANSLIHRRQSLVKSTKRSEV